MHTVKRSGHPADHLSTRSAVLSVDSSTETNYPGPVAHWHGVASNLHGDALGVGLLLILLFAGALLIPFERLIPQEHDGKELSPSTSTGSRQKRRLGGTERGQYDEE